jgi:hypothetical protein
MNFSKIIVDYLERMVNYSCRRGWEFGNFFGMQGNTAYIIG